MPADQMKVFTKDALYVHPVGDQVLVDPEETPNEINGLIVPDKAKAIYPQEGIILEWGPDCPSVPDVDDAGNVIRDAHGNEVLRPLLEPGMRVIFSKYTGLQITVSGEVPKKLLLLPWADIKGYFDPEAPGLEEQKPTAWIPR